MATPSFNAGDKRLGTESSSYLHHRFAALRTVAADLLDVAHFLECPERKMNEP